MVNSFVGEIRLFAGGYAPDGWLVCDGHLITVMGNERLYSLIGTTYGGDGINNFRIPDLRSRVAIGAGAGAGLTPHPVGASGGAQTVTLEGPQYPSHTHSLIATTALSSSQTPMIDNLYGALSDSSFQYADQTSSAGVTGVTFSPNALTAYPGLSGSHANAMPSLGLTYIICILGLHPQFN